jgi:hypothetical protein
VKTDRRKKKKRQDKCYDLTVIGESYNGETKKANDFLFVPTVEPIELVFVIFN